MASAFHSYIHLVCVLFFDSFVTGLAEFIVYFVLSMSFPGMMYYIFFSCNFVFSVYKRKKRTES